MSTRSQGSCVRVSVRDGSNRILLRPSASFTLNDGPERNVWRLRIESRSRDSKQHTELAAARWKVTVATYGQRLEKYAIARNSIELRGRASARVVSRNAVCGQRQAFV